MLTCTSVRPCTTTSGETNDLTDWVVVNSPTAYSALSLADERRQIGNLVVGFLMKVG